MEYDHFSFLIIDKGRDENEKSVIKIEKGRYIGYGYYSDPGLNENIESLKKCTNREEDTHEVQQIIKGFLKRNAVERVIPY